MKLAAAQAIAAVVKDTELNAAYIIPSLFNDQVVIKVRQAVIEAAVSSGIAKIIPPGFEI
ncbi:NAD-dependent malic enzyme [compost metagenome]